MQLCALALFATPGEALLCTLSHCFAFQTAPHTSRLRHGAMRYVCGRCQTGFGSPMAAGTPTAADPLSPRGIAVALAARRHAFRTGRRRCCVYV